MATINLLRTVSVQSFADLCMSEQATWSYQQYRSRHPMCRIHPPFVVVCEEDLGCRFVVQYESHLRAACEPFGSLMPPNGYAVFRPFGTDIQLGFGNPVNIIEQWITEHLAICGKGDTSNVQFIWRIYRQKPVSRP